MNGKAEGQLRNLRVEEFRSLGVNTSESHGVESRRGKESRDKNSESRIQKENKIEDE